MWKHYHCHATDATPSGTASDSAGGSAAIPLSKWAKWALLTIRDANAQPALGKTRTASKNASYQVNYALMALVMDAELDP